MHIYVRDSPLTLSRQSFIRDGRSERCDVLSELEVDDQGRGASHSGRAVEVPERLILDRGLRGDIVVNINCTGGDVITIDVV